jgi:pimeloyl-ACP methyl ester carboxylesterase
MSTMPVREAGRGRPILLLHGWTLHGGFFPAQMEGLAAEARLIAPDLPGHGTNRTGADWSIEAAADACLALIEERDLRAVVLVGWSMGAAVAWSLLERHGSGRIAGLAVVDMTPRVLNDANWHLGIKDGIDAARSRKATEAMPSNWPRYAEHVARTIFGEGCDPDPSLLAMVRSAALEADPVAMAAMWRSLVAQDFRAFLARLELPVLIMPGMRSKLYAPDVACWQKRQLRHCEVVDFAFSGHAPHLEEPDAFNAALGAFCRRL